MILKGISHPEMESLFGNLAVISAALAVVGALILCTGLKKDDPSNEKTAVGTMAACVIGMVQGPMPLPFRGFSRSGATISTGLILGDWKKTPPEDFSFALAVILTPLGHFDGDIKDFFKRTACILAPWPQPIRIVFTECDGDDI